MSRESIADQRALVNKELIERLLASGLLTQAVAVLVVLLTYSALSRDVDSKQLVVWCLIGVSINIIRLLLAFYWRKRLTLENCQSIAFWFSIWAFLAGCCWAYVAVFFSPAHSIFSQMIIIIILACIPPSALASNSFWRPALILFCSPIWFASLVWGYLFGGEVRWQLLAMEVLYMGLVLATGQRMSDSVRNLVRESLQNRILVDEARSMNETLSQMAYEDPLTRMANRRQFESKAEEAMELLKNSTISQVVLLVVDVDNFKQVNDQLGHDAGDELLRQVSKRMMKISRHSEVVIQGRMNAARIGGDEFAILYCIDKEAIEFEVTQLAQRILAALAQSIWFQGKQFWPSVSIGAAIAPVNATSLADLLTCADAAMYRAKRAGGNRVDYCLQTQ